MELLGAQFRDGDPREDEGREKKEEGGKEEINSHPALQKEKTLIGSTSFQGRKKK